MALSGWSIVAIRTIRLAAACFNGAIGSCSPASDEARIPRGYRAENRGFCVSTVSIDRAVPPILGRLRMSSRGPRSIVADAADGSDDVAERFTRAAGGLIIRTRCGFLPRRPAAGRRSATRLARPGHDCMRAALFFEGETHRVCSRVPGPERSLRFPILPTFPHFVFGLALLAALRWIAVVIMTPQDGVCVSTVSIVGGWT
jgi:hypothetical protein